MLDSMPDLVFFPSVEYSVSKIVEVFPFFLILRSGRFHEKLKLATAFFDPNAFDPSKGRLNDFEESQL